MCKNFSFEITITETKQPIFKRMVTPNLETLINQTEVRSKNEVGKATKTE
jgi:hypothetical protein